MADKEAARLAKSIIRESFGELVGVSGQKSRVSYRR